MAMGTMMGMGTGTVGDTQMGTGMKTQGDEVRDGDWEGNRMGTRTGAGKVMKGMGWRQGWGWGQE